MVLFVESLLVIVVLSVPMKVIRLYTLFFGVGLIVSFVFASKLQWECISGMLRCIAISIAICLLEQYIYTLEIALCLQYVLK